MALSTHKTATGLLPDHAATAATGDAEHEVSNVPVTAVHVGLLQPVREWAVGILSYVKPNYHWDHAGDQKLHYR